MTSVMHKGIDDSNVHSALNHHMCMLELAPDGTIANANDNYLALSQYSLGELVGKSYRSLCPVEVLTSNQYSSFWESLRSGTMVSGLFPRVGKNGATFWIEAQYYPLLDSNGQLRSIFMCGHEEEAKAIHSMEAQHRLDAMDRSMLMAEFSPDGYVLSANDNYLSAFSFNLDELIGRHIADLFSENAVYDGICNHVWDYVSTGHTFIGQVEMKSANGETMWLQSIYTPIFDLSGKLAKVAHYGVDITYHVHKEQTEKDSTDGLSLIIDQAGSGIVVADRGNKITYINTAFTEMFGYEPQDILGKSPTCVFGPEEHRLLAELRSMLQTSATLSKEEIVYGKNGQHHYTAFVANPVCDEEGVHHCTVCTFTDITNTKMQEVLQRKALAALSHDIGNSEVLKTLCQEAERIIPEVTVAIMGVDSNRRPFPLAGPSFPSQFFEELNRINDGSATVTAVRTREFALVDNVMESGQWEQSQAAIQEMGCHCAVANPILSTEGEVLGTVSLCFLHGTRPAMIHRQVAEVLSSLCCLTFALDKTRTAMRQITFYDPVTSLPNRHLLVTRVDQMLLSDQLLKTPTPVAVMNVNIDRFKRINDSLGFGAGNVLLDIVAKRLSSRCKHCDLIGRLSGDDFALVFTDCPADRAAVLARRLQNAVSTPCTIGDTEILATVSIGISMYPDNGKDMETLLNKADLALNNARKSVRNNTFGFFSEQDQVRAPMSMESHLHRAIMEEGLSLHYQPQIRFDTGELYGAEALARWTHPELGMVSPGTFIPLAEESGMMEELSDWVVREVARQLRDWRDRNINASHISLNLSAVNFHDPALPDRILKHLEAKSLTPRDIVIELTEGVLLDENPATMTTIHKAHDMGFSLALDDFGTGYSSLSYLRRLPVDTIKLDQVFVRDLNTDETSRKLGRAIMHLCRELGLTMVVEGVENQEQYDLLKSQGYHILQGYYISRPLPVPDFELWVEGTSKAV